MTRAECTPERPCGRCRAADKHDECDCRVCKHYALMRERQRNAEDARTHGGLRADIFQLFGGRSR